MTASYQDVSMMTTASRKLYTHRLHVYTDFVAHDPETQSIVVAHQGTNSRDMYGFPLPSMDPQFLNVFCRLSLLNDAQLLLDDINTDRFPSARGKDIEVHDGFQKTFERTADEVVAAVERGLVEFNVTKVHVMGHSLGTSPDDSLDIDTSKLTTGASSGGSIATLDALLLKQELGDLVEITTTVFGVPRVGNQEFADFVDEVVRILHIKCPRFP